MRNLQKLSIVSSLAILAGCSITQVAQSPLGGIAGGPAGPRDAKISVEPHCCPSTALEIRAREVVGENSFQWVEFGFNVPAGRRMNPISGVEVCYEITSSLPGGTYISQTRLTDMTTPDAAHVKLDDGTDRKDLGPRCYVASGSFEPEGSVTLALKVVFENVSDRIIIGSTRLLF
ncbi:MAG: hypothetical protein K0U98_00100 [Deltaproteobacteria bacterium]|nr:hypothetical protein [Deltaproteobacteria bacterium]